MYIYIYIYAYTYIYIYIHSYTHTYTRPERVYYLYATGVLARSGRAALLAFGAHRRAPRAGKYPETTRKVDIRLPGRGNLNSHGARPVHRIISVIQWIRTNRLSIKNYLSTSKPSIPNRVSTRNI